ncbi:MAG: DUF1501 domain-containing protein [Planctomycetota bacterium]
MRRRDFLRLSGLAMLPALARTVLPGGLCVWASPGRACEPDASEERSAPISGVTPRWDRILLLVELAGGNDGLNTIVPFRDDVYYRLRPQLAIKREACLPLDDDRGLHPALGAFAESWQAHELAIVRGVGYPNPNRSHFRSIEIWETGSDSDEVLQDGWIAEILARSSRPQSLAAESIILGQNGDLGPVSGLNMRNLVLQDPATLIAQAKRLPVRGGDAANPALAHLYRVRDELRAAALRIEEQLKGAPRLTAEFPRTGLGRQLQTAAQLVLAKVPVLVIKATLSGFDTHTNQLGQHARLLGELGQALGAFRAALVAGEQWPRVLVMTYSEFGRRVAENGARGTDHGTAAPHFLLGGAVKGGWYGNSPSLTNLVGGDLTHTVDYRRLYSSVAQEWWQLAATDAPVAALRAHAPLDCIANGAAAKRRESF